ncbi:hypothetical protein Misp01_23620 [Microtetraspora sp. NBRC 13810]|uniref:hypothetical protein n=1 Tax=Microtetraspora sp. NBRC 13810 TaxID=3030990 RepID=UPI0024A4AD85|nr:hypothetical protein [Microtetraspora sp. NBRC 13810]GLW07232.1 hypothetical protein Misp01_23620 [Microtetraspora sp. NBRC 13810]
MSAPITLVDTSLRDGMSSVSHRFTTGQVASVARGLDLAGVRVIEVAHGIGIGASSIQYGFAAATDVEYVPGRRGGRAVRGSRRVVRAGHLDADGEVWSGATIRFFELFDTVQMWMATTQPGFCWLTLDRERDSGVVSLPGTTTTVMAVVDGPDLAYILSRPATTVEASVEFGVHAYGPHAAVLAERVAEQLQVWSRDHRGGPGPQ